MNLTLTEILSVSVLRNTHWTPLDTWSALEWAGAMCGEAGEAANAAKKLRRVETGSPNINEGDRQLSTHAEAKIQVAKECADTILYALLLVARVGHSDDFDQILRDVFNKKSEEYGFLERP